MIAYQAIFGSPFSIYKQTPRVIEKPSLNKLYLKQDNFSAPEFSLLADVDGSSSITQSIWHPVSFAIQIQDNLLIGSPQRLNSSGNLDIDQELLSRLNDYIAHHPLEDGYYRMTWSH